MISRIRIIYLPLSVVDRLFATATLPSSLVHIYLRLCLVCWFLRLHSKLVILPQLFVLVVGSCTCCTLLTQCNESYTGVPSHLFWYKTSCQVACLQHSRTLAGKLLSLTSRSQSQIRGIHRFAHSTGRKCLGCTRGQSELGSMRHEAEGVTHE